MKTELEIAKEKVGNLQKAEHDFGDNWKTDIKLVRCQEHKATCERWLEHYDILREDIQGLLIPDIDWANRDFCRQLDEGITIKIKDLKATIALYKENGT